MSNVKYKDLLFENRVEIDGKQFVPLQYADHIIDTIWFEIDELEIKLLARMIDEIKRKLD